MATLYGFKLSFMYKNKVKILWCVAGDGDDPALTFYHYTWTWLCNYDDDVITEDNDVDDDNDNIIESGIIHPRRRGAHYM